MITSLFICQSRCLDPHYNLAVEQTLLERVKEGQCILYLWQNENTVVIGKNQNPWKECRTALLEEEGGILARRLSGGGAVFHDLGNLNFTFLVSRRDYDLNRQLHVIEHALESLGIATQRSGRNDILADGRKCSGNAFYQNGNQSYHHGTLLVQADLDKLSRYLSPSKAKLRTKGVDSVRSRVVNLKELCPQLTVDRLKEALIGSFAHVYGHETAPLSFSEEEETRIRELTERNRSWEWNYGLKLPFTFECEERFPWGGVQIQLQVEHGLIRQAKLYSDAMDHSLAPAVEPLLIGCRFRRLDLEQALASEETPIRQICTLLCSHCPQ